MEPLTPFSEHTWSLSAALTQNRPELFCRQTLIKHYPGNLCPALCARWIVEMRADPALAASAARHQVAPEVWVAIGHSKSAAWDTAPKGRSQVPRSPVPWGRMCATRALWRQRRGRGLLGPRAARLCSLHTLTCF